MERCESEKKRGNPRAQARLCGRCYFSFLFLVFNLSVLALLFSLFLSFFLAARKMNCDKARGNNNKLAARSKESAKMQRPMIWPVLSALACAFFFPSRPGSGLCPRETDEGEKKRLLFRGRGSGLNGRVDERCLAGQVPSPRRRVSAEAHAVPR